MATSNKEYPALFKRELSRVTRAAAGLIFVVIFSAALRAQTSPTFTMQVDALANCVSMFPSANHNYGTVSHHIDNGVYQVSVTTNVTYHPGCCHVAKVGLYATTDDQPDGWFHVVTAQNPIYLNVTGQGTDPNDVYAYFVDGDCGDNQGTATLYFRKLATMPPICSGKDCN